MARKSARKAARKARPKRASAGDPDPLRPLEQAIPLLVRELARRNMIAAEQLKVAAVQAEAVVGIARQLAQQQTAGQQSQEQALALMRELLTPVLQLLAQPQPAPPDATALPAMPPAAPPAQERVSGGTRVVQQPGRETELGDG